MVFHECLRRIGARSRHSSTTPSLTRRTRGANFEVLESRIAPAALEFSSGLGEQSTLDSVPQATTYLPNVSSSGSQRFSKSDGVANSTVTLTAGPSTTGHPGVNLDVLSQGNVAKHGIASIGVEAGLADGSGTIGSTVDVTIVATDSSEQKGDPVWVQFTLNFNVKEFASNNATANLTCSVSYTYDGNTTSLGTRSEQLGGSGVTPAGSGPHATETRRLEARIGDQFSLTFSESLTGRTVAPYLGGLVNNVGWLVDATLDTSLTKPAIAVITPGLQITSIEPFYSPVDIPQWEQDMSDALKIQGYMDVITYNWLSGTPGGTQAAADSLEQQIVAEANALVERDNIPIDTPIDLKLIGHSRGVAVNNLALWRLANDPSMPVQLKLGSIDDTMLDPHPASPKTDGAWSVSLRPAAQVLGNFLALATTVFDHLSKDPNAVDRFGVGLYDPSSPTFNVPAPDGTKAEVYYQNTPADQAVDFSSKFFNLWGVPDGLTGVQPALTGIADHTSIHEYYRETILPNQPPTESVIRPAEQPAPADESGLSLIYPKYVNNESLARNLLNDLAAIVDDQSKNKTAATIADVVSLENTLALGQGTSIDSHFSDALEAAAGNVADYEIQNATVVVSPIVISNPTSQAASAGNPVSFRATADGGPAPTVQWQVSTDGGNTFADLPGATSRILNITAASNLNNDEYRAVFTNSDGTSTTSPATLTVNTAPSKLVVSATTGKFPQFQLGTPSSADVLYFGAQVVSLANGNIVATDPGSGSVYLFNGLTGALISTLAGTGDGPTVTALPNGNFVVLSRRWNNNTGAATWGNGTLGFTGGSSISAANSLIGIDDFNQSQVIVLPNGNYVVASPEWHDTEGAVTWGNGTTGTSGVVSAANSLVGTQVNDRVGKSVTALSNGNYVVLSQVWNSGGGAATWGNGTTGISGTVSAANSLVGNPDDHYDGSFSLTALTNGNYVVDDPTWNSYEGAVAWGNGATGTHGTFSPGNSLVGDSPNSQVGWWGVTALTNGNYVVDSPSWNLGAGAVTWGNGTTGTFGAVSAQNSLVGSSRYDEVGLDALNHKGVIPLASGNYVVYSPSWNAHQGAATWGNGTTGSFGAVSAQNSLVGVGAGTLYPDYPGGVTPLANGNYVVVTADWNGKEGAVTWGDGTTGTFGSVSVSNSLVGNAPYDYVGSRGVTALTNGNYVVDSPNWYFQEGAVTWASGMTGISGTISASNSLVGHDPSKDQVGSLGVTALTNGNYVVGTESAGSVMLGDGANGTSGTFSPAHSIVFPLEGRIVPLPNGNFVITFAAGASSGEPSYAMWVDGTTGTTLDGQDDVDAQNSFIGAGGGVSIVPIGSGDLFMVATDIIDSQGNLQGTVAPCFTDPNLLTYGLGQGQSISVTPGFLTRTLNKGISVTLQANDDIIVNSPITETPTDTPGDLTLQAGRSLLINANMDTGGGNLSLTANDSKADGVVDTERDPGNASIIEQSGSTINTGAGLLSVDLQNSTDKSNNGRGTVVLPSVSGTVLGFNITGTNPGDGIVAGTYTQLNDTGSLNLNGATLSVTYSATTPVGTTFTIIHTTGGVSGAFRWLDEGATVFASDGTQFRISYRGNGGNDVVLTQLTQPGGGSGVSTPNAPLLSPQSDTGVSSNDGITRDNGSASAPLVFTVGGVSPSDAFVQLYTVPASGIPSPLGSPIQASGGTATVTVNNAALADGVYKIAATTALTAGGTPSALSGTTTVTIQTSVRVTGISPSGSFYTSVPNSGQVTVTFNHPLAGLSPSDPKHTGFAGQPFAVMLIPAGPDGLTTKQATGVYWSGPSGVDSGDLPVPATLAYAENADGTSTITLTPHQPLSTDIYLITIDGLTDLAGNRLADSSGHVGNVYSSFDYRPVNTTPPSVTGFSTGHGSLAIANQGTLPLGQLDAIGVAFNRAMDTYTINASSIQLFAQGSSTPLPEAVVYSPATRTAYVTPETLLSPGVNYVLRVTTGITDDQGFPNPGVRLGTETDLTFSVTGNPPAAQSPLRVTATSPAAGTNWQQPLGYGTVTLSEPLTLDAAHVGRFAAMLVPHTGGVTTGGSGYADVPYDAKLAFNPNTNQLVMVFTGVPTASPTGVWQVFALSGIKAANGDMLQPDPGGALPVYRNFEITGGATSALERPSQGEAIVTVSQPLNAPVGVISSGTLAKVAQTAPQGDGLAMPVGSLRVRVRPSQPAPRGPLGLWRQD